MAARRTERLLNLVICLLATRRYLTAEQIRDAVPGYGQVDGDAFKRMFERDKEELRDLGIPLEVGGNDAWDDERGYRIARRDYEFPELSLSPDEAAAVGLAARLWRSASLADAASRALLKLKAAGVDVDPGAAADFDPRVDAAEPAFAPLLAATRDGAAVAFDYRPSGSPDVTTRHVDAWAVVSWHGRWYLVGHDKVRAAIRVFRLSRVVGGVRREGRATTLLPDDLDPRRVVAQFESTRPPAATARLRVRAGAAWSLRRAATEVRPAGPGWDEVTAPFADAAGYAEWLAGYGSDVVVLEPPYLRTAVVERLQAVAGARTTERVG